MTNDEVRSFIAELQAMFDRIERPTDLDENDAAGCGLLICQYGLKVAGQGLMIYAAGTGSDLPSLADDIERWLQSQPHGRMVTSAEAGELAAILIRRWAERWLKPIATGQRIEEPQ